MSYFNISKANERVRELEASVAKLTEENKTLTEQLASGQNEFQVAIKEKTELATALQAEKDARKADAEQHQKALKEAVESASVAGSLEAKRILAGSGHPGVIGATTTSKDNKNVLDQYEAAGSLERGRLMKLHGAEIRRLAKEREAR